MNNLDPKALFHVYEKTAGEHLSADDIKGLIDLGRLAESLGKSVSVYPLNNIQGKKGFIAFIDSIDVADIALAHPELVDSFVGRMLESYDLIIADALVAYDMDIARSFSVELNELNGRGLPGELSFNSDGVFGLHCNRQIHFIKSGGLNSRKVEITKITEPKKVAEVSNF